MSEEQPGFLGRWARRKTDVLQGKPLHEPATVETPVPSTAVGASADVPPIPVPAASGLLEPSQASDAAQPAEKMLSLEDVKTLTQDSDYTPFMARSVGPEVRNAAMKKLFADPQFNIMDGLDIYIDDYSKSDPIPESMLRQMASSKFLNLFEDEEDEKNEKNEKNEPGQTSALEPGDAAAGVAVDPNHTDPETVAQSHDSSELDRQDSNPVNFPSQPEPSPGSGASQHDHANSHLRLQPDHAPSAPCAGRGT